MAVIKNKVKGNMEIQKKLPAYETFKRKQIISLKKVFKKTNNETNK